MNLIMYTAEKASVRRQSRGGYKNRESCSTDGMSHYMVHFIVL